METRTRIILEADIEKFSDIVTEQIATRHLLRLKKRLRKVNDNPFVIPLRKDGD